MHFSRRRVIQSAAAMTAGLALPSFTEAQNSLSCGTYTAAQTEGPFFTPNSPLKSDFTADVSDGAVMTLAGRVLDRNCRPVNQALVELWHADAAGAYDNQGYRFRGHQFSGADGGFSFRTIRPGEYPGRAVHFHVKVQAPNARVLTTQLYFPDDANRASDWIYDKALDLTFSDQGGERFGLFNFVVPV